MKGMKKKLTSSKTANDPNSRINKSLRCLLGIAEFFMTEKQEKRRDALGLFYESVLKPDHQLRQCAHNQMCYNELMEWRSEIIEYLDNRRNEEFH